MVSLHDVSAISLTGNITYATIEFYQKIVSKKFSDDLLKQFSFCGWYDYVTFTINQHDNNTWQLYDLTCYTKKKMTQ